MNEQKTNFEMILTSKARKKILKTGQFLTYNQKIYI